MNGQEAKHDSGKLQISLVPTQIIKEIARVRMYGNAKYHDPDNWREVEPQRYIDALLRHTLEFVRNPYSVDDESKLYHLSHMSCNVAFLCEMLLADYQGLQTTYDTPYSCKHCMEHLAADWSFCPECGAPTEFYKENNQ